MESQLLPEDEVMDVATNFLACMASLKTPNLAEVEGFIRDYVEGRGDKTYEYYFNLSQVQLLARHTEAAIQNIKVAFDRAHQEEAFAEDQVRFKVQEMHLLTDLFHQFPSVQYRTSEVGERASTWFDFPKSIKNNILVELNINALGEIYSLDSHQLKEVIGSLNWKKFADRIMLQLKEN